MKASCATSYASSLLRRTLYAKRYTRCRYFSTSGSNAATSPARTLSTSAASSVSTRLLVRSPRGAGRQRVRRWDGGADSPAGRAAAPRAGSGAVADDDEGVEPEEIAQGSEAGDLAARDRRDHGVPPELFTAVHVREMH